MSDGLINIDRRGVSVVELPGRVCADDTGYPVLGPVPGSGARWRTVLQRFLEKGALRVALCRVSTHRSLAQNRLLWHVYGQIMDRLRERAVEIGEICPFRDDEDLHEAMKYKCLGITVERFDGWDIDKPATTTRFTGEQFSAYLKAVVGFWATKGIYVEMPEAA